MVRVVVGPQAVVDEIMFERECEPGLVFAEARETLPAVVVARRLGEVGRHPHPVFEECFVHGFEKP